MIAGDDDRDDLEAWQRALRALPTEHRAMVLRMARMLCAAAEAPSPRRRTLAPAPAVNDDGNGADDLARTLARRILARHRRSSGDAA